MKQSNFYYISLLLSFRNNMKKIIKLSNPLQSYKTNIETYLHIIYLYL